LAVLKFVKISEFEEILKSVKFEFLIYARVAFAGKVSEGTRSSGCAIKVI